MGGWGFISEKNRSRVEMPMGEPSRIFKLSLTDISADSGVLSLRLPGEAE